MVYKCSDLLQLAPGSRDLSEAEKRMTVEMFLTFFDHLPPCIEIFYGINNIYRQKSNFLRPPKALTKYERQKMSRDAKKAVFF